TVCIGGVLPEIERDAHAGRHEVSVPIDVRRTVGCLSKSELTAVLSVVANRPQVHRTQVKHGVAARRTVHDTRAIGSPGKTIQRITIIGNVVRLASSGGYIEDVVVEGAAALKSELCV